MLISTIAVLVNAAFILFLVQMINCHNVLQLAQLLPMEENFLLLFRFDNPLDSSVEFMKVSYYMYSH